MTKSLTGGELSLPHPRCLTFSHNKPWTLDRSAERIPVCSLPAFRAGRSQAINKPSQGELEQLEMARDGHEAGVIQG